MQEMSKFFSTVDEISSAMASSELAGQLTAIVGEASEQLGLAI
jgi:hypothetical protein